MPKRQLYYEDIFKKLQEKKIKYLVIGGVAVNLHGVQRATGDIDLILSMDRKNLAKFIAIIKELDMVPSIPVKPEVLLDPIKLENFRKAKNMKVFSFVHPDLPYLMVDVMIEHYFIFNDLYHRRQNVRAWGIDVSVASVEDIIKLKKISARDQDLADIEALKKYGKK